jgi:hypothetical protein
MYFGKICREALTRDDPLVNRRRLSPSVNGGDKQIISWHSRTRILIEQGGLGGSTFNHNGPISRIIRQVYPH